jgi:hypothetical protein
LLLSLTGAPERNTSGAFAIAGAHVIPSMSKAHGATPSVSLCGVRGFAKMRTECYE